MKKRSFLLVLLVLVLVLLPACSQPGSSPTQQPSSAQTQQPNNNNVAPTPEEPIKLSISITGFASEELSANDPILLALEELTNTDLEIISIPDKSMTEKFNAMLAGGTLPDVCYVGNWTSASMLMALESGAFWEIGPYLEKFPNLSQANKDTLTFSSVEGKIYGLYRDRNIGRKGVLYRKDWADKLSIAPPSTIDEFYDMCVAFTHNDPDGNGKNDTFAVSEQASMGSFNTILVWFGAPNTYGVDEKGNIYRDYDTQGWLDGLDFWRKLYAEGLMNSDFISLSSRGDNTKAGKAGITLGAMDDGNGVQTALQALIPEAEFSVVPVIDAGHGARPAAENAGFKGYYGFPTSSLKTEDRLMEALTFFDRMNTTEVNNLLSYGIEGTHYTVENGVAKVTEEQSKEFSKVGFDLGQLRTFNLTVNPSIPDVKATALAQAIVDAVNQNSPIAIHNVTTGLFSATWSEVGSDLNTLMNDAQAKYVMGQLSLDELKEAIAQWHAKGGDKVLEEFTASYKLAHGLN